MKNRIKKLIIKHLPKGIIHDIVSPYLKSQVYYSQEGEDILLERLFENSSHGFYVDVGAHHPIRFSNTYKFYLKGWRGINIDAMPGSMLEFNKIRPKDINLEVPISEKESEIFYYIFNEPALNTFSEEHAKQKDGYRDFKIIKKEKLKTYPLATILNKHIRNGVKISFMSIDVEGFDMQVLKSNDWSKFLPEVILIEDVRQSLEDIFEGEIYNFLKDLNYVLYSKTYNTLVFKHYG